MTDWTDEKYVEVWARLMGYTTIVLGGETFETISHYMTGTKFDPLTDWNQCMMLVEKMEAEGWEVTIGDNWCHLGDHPEDWRDAKLHQARDKTKLRAIIRACALAMEVE